MRKLNYHHSYITGHQSGYYTHSTHQSVLDYEAVALHCLTRYFQLEKDCDTVAPGQLFVYGSVVLLEERSTCEKKETKYTEMSH